MKTSLRIAALAVLIALPGMLSLNAQERIDGTHSIDGIPRNYSLYIPSGYDPEKPNPVMLALHPFNPIRWNSVSWRDTLIAFAEANGLILVCPDGGPDGRLLPEQVDTLAATAILDSVAAWYNIDAKRTYAMGFSVGGGVTYEYGLANSWRFGGYIPIGAGITSGQVNSQKEQATGKPFYIINGADDRPEIRVTPIVAILNEVNAIVESLILPGVGHTIDFPDRNDVFTAAYLWIDSVNLANSSSVIDVGGVRSDPELLLSPNPLPRTETGILSASGSGRLTDVRIVDVRGRTVVADVVESVDGRTATIVPESLAPGLYILVSGTAEERRAVRFIVE